jgi:hypothetical protein
MLEDNILRLMLFFSFPIILASMKTIKY